MLSKPSENMEEYGRWNALYESNLDRLIKIVAERGINTTELAGELQLSEEEIELAQGTLNSRINAYEALRRELDLTREEIAEKFLKDFGELFTEVCETKGISNDTLASKIGITSQEVENLKHCHIGGNNYGEKDEKKIDRELLKKISGVTGLIYSDLLRAAGYNNVKSKPEFYTARGESIDERPILVKLYYKDPENFLSKLESLLEE